MHVARGSPAVVAGSVALGVGAALLASCGRLGFDDRALAGDASLADGAPLTGHVDVTAYASFPTALAGATAWTNLPSGEVDDVATTDGSGHVQLRLTAGGAVSVVVGGDVAPEIQTTLDVAPGGALRFGGAPICDETARGTVQIDWSPYAGASTYELGGLCDRFDEPGTSVAIPLVTDLTDPFDFAIAAEGSADVLAYAVHLAQPLEDGTVVTFGSDEWQAAAVRTIGVSDLPPDVSAGSTAIEVTPSPVDFGIAPPIAAGMQAQALELPPFAATIGVFGTFQSTLHELTVAGTITGLPASTGLVSATPAPAVLDAAAYDADTAQVTWTVTTSGPADALHVQLIVPANGRTRWAIWAPPGISAGALQLPALPPGVDPPPTASLVSVGAIAFGTPHAWGDLQVRDRWNTPYPVSVIAPEHFVYETTLVAFPL